MATDKNNNNKMDANSNDETTSELTILPQSARYADEEAEVDANTFAFDEDTSDHQSINELRSDLRSRDDRIEKLQFDAEQLRARWNGLEKELSAREKLTEILQQDLRSAHKERVAKDKLLKNKKREIESLESYIDGRKEEWGKLAPDIDASKTALLSPDTKIRELETEAEKNSHSRAAAENQIGRLRSRLKKEQNKNKNLREKNRVLMQDIDTYQSDSEFDIGQRLAEQSGQLVSNREEIADLKNQIMRSEKYADSLREGLNDLKITTTDSDARRQQLGDSLEQATGQLRDLQKQLDVAHLLNAALTTTNDVLKKDFNNEVNLIRFELGAAQQTIGNYESENEKLTSNLLDNTHYREALEDQLNVTEDKRASETSRLVKKVKILERQVEDGERKISNKDASLSALLSELASKSQTIESYTDIGKATREIDKKIAERTDDGGSQERERPSRVLIGMIGGKELQFPLFKDRLTIGRTRQNDIQLNAQFISRRHAVIMSDEDGPRIIDWGSRNGIFVNDLKVSEQRLSSGDKVTIGTAEFVFEERQKR